MLEIARIERKVHGIDKEQDKGGDVEEILAGARRLIEERENGRGLVQAS